VADWLALRLASRPNPHQQSQIAGQCRGYPATRPRRPRNRTIADLLVGGPLFESSVEIKAKTTGKRGVIQHWEPRGPMTDERSCRRRHGDDDYFRQQPCTRKTRESRERLAMGSREAANMKGSGAKPYLAQTSVASIRLLSGVAKSIRPIESRTLNTFANSRRRMRRETHRRYLPTRVKATKGCEDTPPLLLASRVGQRERFEGLVDQ